ncbi:MAG: hypothetical protein BGO70_01185 [Bacteroidetes bacterium 43-93]|uniref:hypothetical protein n=1 Tax=uncultured Dysgonomonas sp. TaxID=206096 RepID=UPI00092C39F6|nr:hypothetical protein [uncultured Dysgonomonas sp.]MBN9483110.1 hypothetical protein [Bacteroidota bacterium]OJW96326.1 MAG: hypothetical protein BGO70_01185 [Bacteroidetes bacterium 43-93]
MKALRLTLLFLVTSLQTRALDSLGQYYTNVYQAEKCILNRDYKNAAQYYEAAFLFKHAPFTLDICNYSYCAALNNDYDNLIHLSRLLVLKGADTFFFRKSIYNGFRKSKEWSSLIKEYPQLTVKRDQTINYALIKRINDFIYRDQSVHCILVNNAKDSEFVARMNRINDSLSESLIALMYENDYLSEEVIGATFNDSNFVAYPIYHALVIHEFQKHGDKLTKPMYEAIKKGKIRSDIGLKLMQNGGNPRIVFDEDYIILHDTLWTMDLRNAIPIRRIVRILYDTTNIATEKRAEFYCDESENIKNKIYYNYRRYIFSKINKLYYNPFIIVPIAEIMQEEPPKEFYQLFLVSDYPERFLKN